ncbi:hypothetical protein WJX74_004427 [Apatococcus lobatus]|uniref:Luc7-like protein 3 n=1 Tax=Apatococcus lobatus TaxID=904363 RepID=A0AAW1Q1Y7_9CHLO
MVDAMRAMLDELMGENRNGDREKVERPLNSREICKHHLCGFCPYVEFERTKHDFGQCPLLHDEDAKERWDALDDAGKERLGHEHALMKWLDQLMADLRAKIKKNTERLKAEQESPVYLKDDQTALGYMNDSINELLARSEKLGEDGDVDGAQAVAAQAEHRKTEKAKFEGEARQRAGGNSSRYGEQEVCPLSGVIVNVEETRVRDHKMGRNYRAWCKFHEVYKALMETFAKRGLGGLPPPPLLPGAPPGPSPAPIPRLDSHRSGGEMGRSREPEDGRDRDRHRDRDRERERGRVDRHRAPASDWPRDRERGGSHHSRDHDRDRGHRHPSSQHRPSGNRHRSRSPSRAGGRERDYGSRNGHR